MPATLHFADAQVRDDLATYLGRAGRIEDGGVRLQAVPGGVACWVPVLRPAGLLADSPLVMGVRGIPARLESDDPADFDGDTVDMVVSLRGMLDRFAREPESDEHARQLALPAERLRESWTGQRPPLGDWMRTAMLSSDGLISVAEDGIAEVGERTGGGGLGQILAEQVRTATWTRPLPDLIRLRRAKKSTDTAAETRTAASAGAAPEDTQESPLPPAGAAFAAHALGFLRPGELAAVHEAPGWWRIGLPRGQVLIRRR